MPHGPQRFGCVASETAGSKSHNVEHLFKLIVLFVSFAGITAGDKVGIISNNRWEWAAIASACYSLNANLVPMYEAQLPSDWTYILNDSGAKAVFSANHEIWKTVQEEVLPETPLLSSNLVLTTPVDEPDAEYALENVMARLGADSEGSLIVKPTPEDLANLIYTSGTTG